MSPDANPSHPSDRASNIAVVVVHGVSDQQPHDSAHTIADLLFSLDQEDAKYAPFTEQFIRIPVQKLALSASSPQFHSSKMDKNWLGWLDERGERTREKLNSYHQHSYHQHSSPPDPATNDRQLDDRSHDFTCDFLKYYDPQDLQANFYETVCLQTYRSSSNRSTPQAVHLYEMYWADLSRLGRGFVQIFSELYQLLFHLSSLGRHTLDMATLEYGSTNPYWRSYSCLHGWAGRFLSIPIPLLNLYLLIAVFLSIPGNLDRFGFNVLKYTTLGLTCLFLVAITGYLLWRNFKRSLLQWIVLPLCAVFAIVVLQGGLQQSIGYYRLLSLEWFILLAVPIGLLIKRYALRRPGAGHIAIGLGAVSFVVIIFFLFTNPDSHFGITKASFQVVEWIYSLMLACWFIFYLLYIAVIALGFFLPRCLSQQDAKERAKRATWTAHVSLWAPAVLFVSITLSLWAALARVGSPLLPPDFRYSPTPLFKYWFLSDVTEVELPGFEFLGKLILGSPLLLFVIFCVILLAIVAIAWSFLPSIWAEIQPPNPSPKSNSSVLSLRFGVWLTKGFKFMYGVLNGLAIILALGVIAHIMIGALRILNLNPDLYAAIAARIQPLEQLAQQPLSFLAILLPASATGILVLGRQLDQLSLGIRSVLDVILDVDNYLRLHPQSDNPRARIFSRYAALLRYLGQWRDASGRGYDALLIVAHSQGTVITADLLRFLNRERHQDLKWLFPTGSTDSAIPTYFFSMGCPLSQLYGVGFPHLYNWALNFDRQAAFGQKPDPTQLGLDLWVNTFRSSDYVGRYLWRSGVALEPARLFNLQTDSGIAQAIESQVVSSSGTSLGQWQEFCLGAGAHTHYWDRTAIRVAAEIDQLIDRLIHKVS